MKRQSIILFILFSIIAALQVFYVFLVSTRNIEGLDLSKIEEKIKSLKAENNMLYLQILKHQSLEYSENLATPSGFIKNTDYWYIQ